MDAQRSIRIRTRRAGSGSRIKIGVFLDEDCSVHAESQDVEDYLKDDDGYPMKLSYHLLKQTFVEGYCVASCLRDDDGEWMPSVSSLAVGRRPDA